MWYKSKIVTYHNDCNMVLLSRTKCCYNCKAILHYNALHICIYIYICVYVYIYTFVLMSLLSAMHLRHFLNENPTPSLNPPTKLLPSVSPIKHKTAP